MIALWWMGALDAQAGKTTKIEQALAAYEGGDASAWEDASERHGKVSEKFAEQPPTDPVRQSLAVLAGRMYLARASREPAEAAGALEQALTSLEQAAAMPLDAALRAQAEVTTTQLASTLVAALTNQVEGKAWDEAAVTVAQCVRATALADTLGQRDDARTAAWRKLATRVAVQAGDVVAAREHYGSLHELTGTWDGALGVKVARKLAEITSPTDATTFLWPILEAMPTDEALLRAWVELSLAAKDPDAGTARLDGVYAQLVTSKSGALLLGELYDSLGRRDQARAAYEALLAQEPSNIQANEALARFWLASARTTRSTLDDESAARRPSKEAKQLQATVQADLLHADERATAALAANPDDRALHALLLEILVDRQAALPKGDKGAKALEERVAGARAKLAALPEGP
jgi:tetratricopeptide (TPR) repeat protein